MRPSEFLCALLQRFDNFSRFGIYQRLIVNEGRRRCEQSALQIERAAVTGEAVKFGFCHCIGELFVQFGDLRSQSLGLRFEVFLLFLQRFDDSIKKGAMIDHGVTDGAYEIGNAYLVA